MTTAELSHFTQCGLPGIDRIPFGMHACHFYGGRDDLIATLVPYFLAGLRNKERCLWVTAPPLPAQEAIGALRAGWDGVDDAIHANALRILDHDRWYSNPAGPKGLDVIRPWLREEENALAEGYAGLHIARNTSFLAAADWQTFMDYERALSAAFHGRRIVTLCSYASPKCSEHQTDEVMQAHNCALERPDADWRVVASL